jgi:hypothetical protein
MLIVTALSGITWLIWLIAACVVIGRSKPRWSLATAASSPTNTVSTTLTLWSVPILLLALGIGLLPIGQPEQQRRREAEKLLRAGELDRAVQYMSALSRDEFPPIWDPPPRTGYGEKSPSAMQVLTAAEQNNAPQWVRNLYIDKLSQNPGRALGNVIPADVDGDTSEFERVLSVFEKYVPAESLDLLQLWDLQSLADNGRLNDDLRDRLKAYLAKAENRAD